MEDLDLSLVGELLETIERHPPGIEARKLLIQTYIEANLLEAAGGAARELLEIDPNDADAQEWLLIFCPDDSQHLPENQPLTGHQSSVTRLLPGDLDSAMRQLSQGYQELRIRAKRLQGDLHILRGLLQEKGLSLRYDKHIHHAVTEIANGRVSKARVRRPGSARSVSRAMEAEPDKALEIAITDLAGMARWLRTPTKRDSAMDNDQIRDALAKRVRTLIAALPDGLQPHASAALMHVEHEVLKRSYVCDETMYGDPIADVPRERFWVSEDGYAWDMEELAQAVASNGGVMRNPLSRQMFTPNDVRAIVQHPLGSRLAALQVEQSKLSQGVRLKTIEQLETLAQTLLNDMSLDSIPSRHAVDSFLAYVATLPQAEQRAIDVLRVPAKDSHTGQPFDTSIGEAVRDAQGNRVCFHKTGDFIRQAAHYLRSSAH